MIRAAVFTLLATPALAEMPVPELGPCDWQASAIALAEPWERNTRTFADGAVRLALMDHIEPAAGPFRLLILSPPYGELGDRQCATIGIAEGVGFAGVDFAGLEASYDPSVGLIFDVSVQVFDPDADRFVPAHLVVTLNQSTGEIGGLLQ